MALSPQVTSNAFVSVVFESDGQQIDVSSHCDYMAMTSMMNNGYVIEGKFVDPDYNILRRLNIDLQYLNKSRSSILKCRVKFAHTTNDNSNETSLIIAHVVSIRTVGSAPEKSELFFTAIDPPSWFLNAGDASGKAYRGNISSVIRQCIQEYAPGVATDIAETIDSNQNVYYMMRMDPKTFLLSLLEWSSSLTQSRTNWIVNCNNYNIRINDQANLSSSSIGFYQGPTVRLGAGNPHIRKWKLITNNFMSILNSKFISSGMSMTTGQYLDPHVDQDESILFVKDSTTSRKYTALTNQLNSFLAPNDTDPSTVGWTSIPPIPEIDGIGLNYEQYIDGRARSLWLNMLNMLMRVRFTVYGHGVLSPEVNLGADTIMVDWRGADNERFMLSGNWLVYGYKHIYKSAAWDTQIFCARYDFNSASTKVPNAEA